MIPRAFITEWREYAPWKFDAQVEQDLILCRVLVELFSDKTLSGLLAFRGGTALHKLFLQPPTRYSEDIDLVQTKAVPIGDTIDGTRELLDNLLGNPRIQQKHDAQVMIYRVQSEIPPTVPLRIKIEINSREHFNVLGLRRVPYQVASRWFSGSCTVMTYELDELMGTKLRALYQRRKGRDLFDLWLSLTKGKANPHRIIEVFHKYVSESGLAISGDDFMKNVALKMNHDGFLHDTDDLIRPDIQYNCREAYELVRRAILEVL